MDNITVCVVSRIYIGELPYIHAFIKHYLNIGFDTIYLIITNPTEENIIKKYANWPTNIIFIHSNLNSEDRITMDSMNHVLQNIKETYILHIDIDEFLEIYPLCTIKDVIHESNTEKIHFNWAITVFDNISGTLRGAKGMTNRNKPFKTLCKRDIIHKFTGNGHDFETTTQTTGMISKYHLIHYWGRSFDDILIKIIYGNGLKNAKSSSLEELNNAMLVDSIHSMPVRLKMLALLSKMEKPIQLEKNYIENNIDLPKENELIYNVLSKQQRDAAFNRYNAFKENLDIVKYTEIYYKTGLFGTIMNM